jgi:predicted DNA-binding transcriptional regulator AlpA
VTSNYGLTPQERAAGQFVEPIAPAKAIVALPLLLVPAGVAGPMCGRSEASWWRDHAARRVPAPIKLGGRTLWRTQELREWVESGCPDRRTWEALRSNGRK